MRSPWQFKPGNDHPTSSLRIHLQRKVVALQGVSSRERREASLDRECILSTREEVNQEPETEELPSIEQVCKI